MARPAGRHRPRGRDPEQRAPLAQDRRAVDRELLAQAGRGRGEPGFDRLDAVVVAAGTGLAGIGQWKTSPPFTSIPAPVTMTDRSDARNNAAFAHSSSVGMTPSAMFDAISVYSSSWDLPIASIIWK